MSAGERLRVAQVIGTFEGGGAQRQAYNLVVGLEDLGADAKGIALTHVGDFVRWSTRADRFVELGADRKRPLTVLRAALRFRRLVARWRPHVLHVQGTDTLPFVRYALRGMRRQPRTYFTWQDSGQVLQQQGSARTRLLAALERCEEVFGASRDIAARLSAGGHLARVGIFHGGVPETAAASPVSPPLILWVGRFLPAKDPERLVRAAIELRAAGLDFRVLMVGIAHPGSTHLEEIRDLVRREGLGDVVKAPGYVADEELERTYRDAAIGVQTSLTEGLSMVLLEQMMLGLAVVATDVGDTSVALDGGKCGILVGRDSGPGTLAKHLKDLILDASLRRRLGEAARARALSHYSIAAMSRRALGIYEAAARLGGAGAS